MREPLGPKTPDRVSKAPANACESYYKLASIAHVALPPSAEGLPPAILSPGLDSHYLCIVELEKRRRYHS